MKAMNKLMLATLMTACAVDESNVVEPDDMVIEESAGTVTIDSSEFVVENGTWWTTTSAPKLHGTFEAKTSVTITVQAGASAPVTASLTDKQWSVQLPVDSINSSFVDIKITMTATSGAKTELVQAFGLDSAPPSVRLLPSKVRDERGDQIDFSTGQPVHSHAGAEVDLATGLCPSTYKYTYLMDAPMFGRATSPNDLVWHVKVSDAKLASQQFRVRRETGPALIDWTDLGDRIKLDRKNVPQLGTDEGKYFIDVRAKDWSNLETTSTFCFDHHVLQTPLRVKPIEKGELFDMTFANKSQMSRVIESSVVIATQTIEQQTTEPVLLAYSPAVGATTYTAAKFYGWVEEVSSANTMCQPDVDSDPRCKITKPVGNAPTRYTQAGDADGTYTVELLDTSTMSPTPVVLQSGKMIGYVIPGRAANEAPHSYMLRIRASYGVLRPDVVYGWAFADHMLMGVMYTGEAPFKQHESCSHLFETAWGWMCSQQTTFWSITALDQATISFASIGAKMELGHREPSYVSASDMSTGPLTWDAGDLDIPGSQY